MRFNDTTYHVLWRAATGNRRTGDIDVSACNTTPNACAVSLFHEDDDLERLDPFGSRPDGAHFYGYQLPPNATRVLPMPSTGSIIVQCDTAGAVNWSID